MKKFVFTLEKVLSVKEQMYEVKRNELFILHQRLNDIETRIEDNEKEYKKYNEDVNEKPRVGTTAPNIDAYKKYFVVLENEAIRLQKEKEEMDKRISEKQQEVLDVKTEISGLEKLREKQFAEYNKELQKQQEREIEEFVNEKISSG